MSLFSDKRVSTAFSQIVQDGRAIALTIQDTANDLAFLMGQLHGEPFTADINHDIGFLMIRCRDLGASS